VDQHSFYKLMQERQSVRAYLPDAVPQQVVEELITTARLAPSGANLQPGEFHVLAGDALAALKNALLDAAQNKRPTERPGMRCMIQLVLKGAMCSAAAISFYRTTVFLMPRLASLCVSSAIWVKAVLWI
jgi:nitroreductase